MKRKQNVVEIVMVADNGLRTSNALIRNVGDKAVNAEDQTTFCDGEELVYER